MRNLRFFFFFFLILILILPGVLSIGIRGSNLKEEIVFEPGLTKNFGYQLVTHSDTQDYEFYIRSYRGDDLTEYFTLSKTLVEDVPPNAVYPFGVAMALPGEIETPGWHEVRIGVRETVAGGGNVGGKTASEARILILVLYPYKYLQARLSAQNTNIDEISTININLDNYGEPDVENVYAVIDVYDKDQEKAATLTTNTVAIKSRESNSITANYLATNVGYYTANATIYFDGNQTTATGKFRVGDLELDITKYTNTYYTGLINKVVVTTLSGWNDVIRDLYCVISIKDEAGNELANTRTPNYDVAAFREQKLESYLDFTNTPVGNYTIDITAFFEGRTTTKTGIIQVVIPKEPELEKPKKTLSEYLTINTLLYSVVGLNLLIMLVLLLLLLKRKDEKEKKK